MAVKGGDPEVWCLQTGVQLGEHSDASRLRAPSSLVDGPRVQVAMGYTRTVMAHDTNERYVHRACSKTGVSGRSDLGALIAAR